jgi:hypothetical protein
VNEYSPLIRTAAGVPAVTSRIAWPEIETKLGLSLPEDYKEFSGALKECRDLEKKFGEQAATHLPVYPEPDGILPWGRVEDDWILAWKTAGEPSTWESVGVSFEFRELHPLPGSMSQALYRLIIGETGAEMLDYLSEVRNFVRD